MLTSFVGRGKHSLHINVTYNFFYKLFTKKINLQKLCYWFNKNPTHCQKILESILLSEKPLLLLSFD